jgi:hypothetical protein
MVPRVSAGWLLFLFVPETEQVLFPAADCSTFDVEHGGEA